MNRDLDPSDDRSTEPGDRHRERFQAEKAENYGQSEADHCHSELRPGEGRTAAPTMI
ncbi:hypothetical protein AB0I87_32245 [Streptomyces sp. NPDC049952]|uniref:hypothetical protein n=1 Tax=Streptomyces TaxID=1883 RepID=UPI00131BA3C0|nr:MULTISPECIES: hypothetical protein [unclassified Streptomyces]MDX2622902.1 hypothetical protein [Streptomyces sp. WI03-5b]MEE1774645.1 hypothetical protein [Streptomyces sp. JV181]MYT56577.1 hypothetical protein [Streptomyces sp. SID7834]